MNDTNEENIMNASPKRSEGYEELSFSTTRKLEAQEMTCWSW